MKSVIRWAIRNAPAMNTLMIAILVVGGVSLVKLRREVFPEFELEIILVSVAYPGASPEEVEEGVCQKIEEAVHSIDGVKKQTSVAREGAGFLILELDADADVQKALAEVNTEIDGILSFPELAEEPDVQQVTFRVPAIRVGVISQQTDDPSADWRLREITEQVRDELLELPSVSQANIVGGREFQIDVEIPEDQLRAHGLTLQQVADILRRENLELPGGSIRTESQEVLLRGNNKSATGTDIGRLPVLTGPDGAVVTVEDLGDVQDDFVDTVSISSIDGRPGLVISVDRTKSEDLLRMAAEVREYVETRDIPGYELTFWADQSVDVEDRMLMLVRNGLQGLALVFLVLAIFLELRLAFWVALGIPIAVLGAGAVLLFAGQTLNMLTMFAFLMALGIVVDDAIVIGENIYKHREMGKTFVAAAVEGTREVLSSVVASVSTTIIAFMPLMFVSGVMGKFIACMPLAVIAMLVISLIESLLILPCHLAHPENLFLRVVAAVLTPLRMVGKAFHWANERATRLLFAGVERFYVPALRWSLARPAIVLSGAVAMLLVLVGMIQGGLIPFVLFPKMDNRSIEAKVVFPDGSPESLTDECTRALEESFLTVARRYREGGEEVMAVRHRMVGMVENPAAGPVSVTSGGHVGSVSIELVPVSDRDATSQELLDEWREEWRTRYADRFPGAESLTFGSPEMGPGGKPIEFKLLSAGGEDGVAQLETAVEEAKRQLASYDGVRDVDDDSRPGKWEYQIRIKDSARALDVTLADLAETIRASYYGAEVMRLQRGRHEVKLMVRYPEAARRTLASFREIRVRTQDGVERPLTELADVTVRRGYSEINRVDQQRSITVFADLDEGRANAREIVADLQSSFMPQLLEEYPLVSVRWEGQQEQSVESMRSMLIGLGIALVCMFALLTLEFRSYVQPIMILAIVPFGFIGAFLGHMIMGLDVTLFSLFGMIALTGVVVNDSIVLIDFMNHRISDGYSLSEGIVEAGRRRFRPVLLTSVTTIAGLTPMLLETSFQAQVLIPVACSLCFGLLLGTFLILLLVPVFYSVYGRVALTDVPWSSADEAGFAESAPDPSPQTETEVAVTQG